jgi:hypothetical protein
LDRLEGLEDPQAKAQVRFRVEVLLRVVDREVAMAGVVKEEQQD